MRRGIPCRIGWMVLLMVLSPGLGACGDSGTGPEIESLMPSAASPGEVVEVLGKRFCGGDADDDGACASQPDGVVSFGADASLRGLVAAWSDTRISLTVPSTAPLGATLVVVTVDGVSSNEVAFDVR